MYIDQNPVNSGSQSTYPRRFLSGCSVLAWLGNGADRYDSGRFRPAGVYCGMRTVALGLLLLACSSSTVAQPDTLTAFPPDGASGRGVEPALAGAPAAGGARSISTGGSMSKSGGQGTGGVQSTGGMPTGGTAADVCPTPARSRWTRARRTARPATYDATRRPMRGSCRGRALRMHARSGRGRVRR